MRAAATAVLLPTLCSLARAFLVDGDDDLSLLQANARKIDKVAVMEVLGKDSDNRELDQAAIRWPSPGDPNARVRPEQIAAIEFLKRNPHNMAIANATMDSFAQTPVWYVIQQGGYDLLFTALHEWDSEPSVQLNAWRGLSDQSHTELGSWFINNYGGPNEGIKYMVEQLQAHPLAREVECADHLTYQYEVLQCICGLLRWDVNGTRSAAAVEAGLVESTLHVLTVESDIRPSVDVACRVAVLLLEHSDAAAPRFKELGAKQLILQAMYRFPAYDPTPFYFGTTYGSEYPVRPSCQPALAYL